MRQDNILYFQLFNCRINNVAIPNGEIRNYAFGGCTNLRNVHLGNGVPKIEGGFEYEGAFDGCRLISLYLPRNLNDIFCGFGCTIESVEVDPENPNYYSEGNCVITKGGRKILVLGCKNSVIPNDVAAINSYAFAGQTDFHSLIVPEGVGELYWMAFGGSALTDITLPASITQIEEEMFGEGFYTDDGSYTVIQNADITIRAVPGSTAQEWATANGFKVICIGNHAWEKWTAGEQFQYAACAQDGTIVYKCTVCNETKTENVPMVSDISISSDSFIYNGSVQQPAVTVTDRTGKALTKGTDYTVTYSSGSKAAGAYSATVNLKGNYSGKAVRDYTIAKQTLDADHVTLS